jgi:hypothetical protein
MKKTVGVFIFLLFLLPACGTRIITEPVVQVQYTPLLITTLLSTFTPQPQQPSRTPFCQGEPEYIRLGSPTKITVFSLPANQSLAVYLGSKLVARGTANMDGYASIPVLIPADETVGPHQVSIYATGTPIIVTCQIQLWSDLTPSSTFQPAPTLTSEPTLSPNQLTMTATQQSLKDRLGANCWYGSAQAVRLSPNGQWAEAICGPDSIIIIRTDGAKEWSLSSDSLIGPYTEHFIQVAHWSNDGTYVYVFANPHTDGYWEPFHQGIVLYRLTLESGQISELLPLRKSGRSYYSFSFSPNDRRLAYIATDQSPAILHLRDMQTGVEQSFEFEAKYNTGGGFVWSPDSQNLVFAITQYDENIHEYIATSVIVWEREKSNTTMLIKDHEDVLVPVEWNIENKIVLELLYKNDIRFEFDIVNNELKQINP